jgi:hypothetical protein
MFLTCGVVEADVLHTIDAAQGTSTQKFGAVQPLKSKDLLCHFHHILRKPTRQQGCN